MKTTQRPFRKTISTLIIFVLAVIPIACTTLCALTLRCGIITGDFPSAGSIYYCVRDTAPPEVGDLVLLYGDGFSKSICQVETVTPSDLVPGGYKITVIDDKGNERDSNTSEIFGKIHVLKK